MKFHFSYDCLSFIKKKYLRQLLRLELLALDAIITHVLPALVAVLLAPLAAHLAQLLAFLVRRRAFSHLSTTADALSRRSLCPQEKRQYGGYRGHRLGFFYGDQKRRQPFPSLLDLISRRLG